jgi:ribosomal protein S18 acetylase RimI-like enzyme
MVQLRELKLEHPTSADIPALVELWNAAFGPGFPLNERLLRQTLEADPWYEPEGCWVARDGTRTVGWVLSKSMKAAGTEMGRFQGRGGIGALCVHPDYQRCGIATQLLDEAEGFLRASGSSASTLYYPHHLLPGIPAECEPAIELFRKRGYTGFQECVDLWRDLEDYEIPVKAQASMTANPTVYLRPARTEEIDAIISMVEREFPGGWPYSTRGHFARGGAASDIIVAVENGEVIGFCHTADWRSPWLLPSTYWHPLLGEFYGGLGPVGIAAAHRKRGLGLALCAVAVVDLKQRGVARMAIDWTTLVSFYEQLGFTVWKHYLQAQQPVSL